MASPASIKKHPAHPMLVGFPISPEIRFWPRDEDADVFGGSSASRQRPRGLCRNPAANIPDANIPLCFCISISAKLSSGDIHEIQKARTTF